MPNRFQLMRRFFESTTHFAAFLGVPVATLRDWISERRQPCRAALRLLWILERLEGDPLHAALVEQARPVKRERVKTVRLKRPVVAWSHEADTMEREWLARAKRAPSPVRPVVNSHAVLMDWPDDYWYPRTVTLTELAEGVKPAVVDDVEFLRRMTDEQEAAYNDSYFAYRDRTGRVMPEPDAEF